jgi:medium-chain acyl-[acyl-carrier-protein] hydrolase
MSEEIDIFGRISPDARAIVYAFHHAGGNAQSFAGCVKHLPSELALLRVQIPGRDSRSRTAPATDIAPLLPPLTDAFLANHRAVAGGRPFAFYGHSLGALLSFELARALRAGDGPMPTCLFVSGRRAPQCGLARTALCLLPDDELMALLPALGGVPPSLLRDPRWGQRFMPIIRADLAVSDLYDYRPQPPLACPILAFKGRNDLIVSFPELAAWKMQTQGEFVCRELSGTHFFDPSGTQTLRVEILARLDAWLKPRMARELTRSTPQINGRARQ